MVHDADNNEERGTYTFACHHIGNPEAASKDLPKKFDKVWDMVMLLLQVSFGPSPKPFGPLEPPLYCSDITRGSSTSSNCRFCIRFF